MPWPKWPLPPATRAANSSQRARKRIVEQQHPGGVLARQGYNRTSRPRRPTLLARLLVRLHFILPLLTLSRLAARVARFRGPGGVLIRIFAWLFSIDREEAARPVPRGYASLAEFFSRELKDGARIPENGEECVVSPADGLLTRIGEVNGTSHLQAKGAGYSIEELLGGARCAAPYEGGHVAVIYLRPSDYHRVRMPLAGQLREVVYLPGRRLSVNPAIIDAAPAVLATNERAALHFDTGSGKFCVVMVGALNVGSISTAFDIRTDASIPPVPTRWRFPGPRGAKCERGDYLAHFNLGSTVVLVATRDLLAWLPERQPVEEVRCGQALGQRLPVDI
ncbi:MAG: phosphatidylserine decarboxylase [Gammaproteobacteria bacterium]|nr:phosphatidylserine decarboxylase [Gammaproteobacteria bacterium]